MKKISLILAVAFATFTLTACGEKAPTPEEMKLAARQEREKAIEKIEKARKGEITLTPEQEDSIANIINKGRKENEPINSDELDSLIDIINKGRNENEKEMEKPKRWRKPGDSAPMLKPSIK